MKEVDGLTATRQIKAAWPDARIMIVTNYDDPQLRQSALLAGACEYVTKENLLAVRRVLEENLPPTGVKRPFSNL